MHLIDKENVHFKKNNGCSWVEGELNWVEGKLNYQTCTIDSNKTVLIMMLKIQARKLDTVENENDESQRNQRKKMESIMTWKIQVYSVCIPVGAKDAKLE